MDGPLKVLPQSYEPEAPLSELKEHPKNPNRGDLVVLRESIETNGVWGAVLVQKSTGYVVAGNHRLRVARALGMESIPAIYLDVNDATARRILLADNRTSRKGLDDQDLLAEILREVLGEEGTLLGTGYSAEDLARAEGEGLLDLATPEEKGGVAAKASLNLRWPGGMVPMTEEESERLSSKLSEYQQANGLNWGFVTSLLGAAR